MRRSLIAVSLAALALPAALFAIAHGAKPRATTDAERVLAVEDAYARAEIDRDEAALRRIVDDRFVMNSGRGTIADKDGLVRSLLATPMIGQTITERTMILERGFAIVCATAEVRTAAAEGREDTTALRYTSVYVERPGGWRLLGLHMSPRAARAR